ncbi:MAG: hypothetical protein JXP34_06430 [Planctomycetes bacterium]|nr:hypothetical protein [Planctomycetota bacterium]
MSPSAERAERAAVVVRSEEASATREDAAARAPARLALVRTPVERRPAGVRTDVTALREPIDPTLRSIELARGALSPPTDRLTEVPAVRPTPVPVVLPTLRSIDPREPTVRLVLVPAGAIARLVPLPIEVRLGARTGEVAEEDEARHGGVDTDRLVEVRSPNGFRETVGAEAWGRIPKVLDRTPDGTGAAVRDEDQGDGVGVAALVGRLGRLAVRAVQGAV